tara:strand:- start:3207 stop:3902 length:696 start_codon:yes stop_codon:yes gene_type:complete
MKFFDKIMKSKLFRPIVSVILVLLAMYVLYRLFSNPTEEGYDGGNKMRNQEQKLVRVFEKIQQLGPEKLNELFKSIPIEISNIIKEEGMNPGTVLGAIIRRGMVGHAYAHAAQEHVIYRYNKEVAAHKDLANDIKQNGSQQYYDNGELLFYKEDPSPPKYGVWPDYSNSNWNRRVIAQSDTVPPPDKKKYTDLRQLGAAFDRTKHADMKEARKMRANELSQQNNTVTTQPL